jgi:hypothetical protein
MVGGGPPHSWEWIIVPHYAYLADPVLAVAVFIGFSILPLDLERRHHSANEMVERGHSRIESKNAASVAPITCRGWQEQRRIRNAESACL